MLEKNYYTDNAKQEINKLLSCIHEEQINANKHLLTKIFKSIIFFKQIELSLGQSHYSKLMISDALFLIHSFSLKSSKIFYVYYRSFIENCIRFILEYNDNNDTGVRNMFNELNLKCSTKQQKDLCNFIWSEYCNSCKYVHSNIKANNMDIYEYFKDITEKNSFSTKETKLLLNKLITYINKYIALLCSIHNSWIDEAFFRKKTFLIYLIGKKKHLHSMK